MKKWMAMVLALCMLCGMVNVATAEEYQTVSTAYVDFDIPANAEYEIHDHGGNVNIFVYSDQWDMNIRFNTNASGSEHQQMAFDEAFGYQVENFGWPTFEYADWGLADGEVVKACCTVEGVPMFGFAHAFDWGFMDMDLYITSETMDEADFIEVVKPIFQSVRMPGEPSPVNQANVKQDAAPVGKQPLTIGRASFELDADLEIIQTDGHQWLLMNDQYVVVFNYYEYGEDNIDFTQGDMQIDNCFFINYIANGNDQQTALNVCNMVQRKDIGMPGGDDVLYIAINGVTMLSHYYPNMGFMMMAQCQDGSLSDDEMLSIVEEIALSFRVDGMTAEEMGAYKEQAEAELAAAIAAAEAAAAEEAARMRVYIVNAGANIRSGPDSSYSRILYAYQGDSFPYLGEEGTWYKIDVNGQTGYVSKSLCEVK